MYPFCQKRILFFGCGLLLTSWPMFGARDLVDQSPFLPPGFLERVIKSEKPPPPKRIEKPVADIVFKGFFRLGGVWKFSILDKKTGKAKWVLLDSETDDGLILTAFDPSGPYLTYKHNGQIGELELASPSSGSVPIQRNTSGTKPQNKGSIPSRSSPRSTIPKPINSKIPSRNIVSSSGSSLSRPSGSASGQSPTKVSPTAAPSAPPATAPPSFIPKLPAHLASGLPSGIANAMKDAEDRGQGAVKLDLGTLTPPETTPTTSPVATAPSVPSSVFTAPAINASPSATIPQQPQIIPRRAPLNLPPGIPPPPTTAPPSLPDFLNVGGPPSPPPGGKP
ncbi:MAG: hypothetical protein HN675_16600 [Opitutae bacterium]|nr:hypothetical protein [Opitutae bacterium]